MTEWSLRIQNIGENRNIYRSTAEIIILNAERLSVVYGFYDAVLILLLILSGVIVVVWIERLSTRKYLTFYKRGKSSERQLLV